MNNNLSPTYLRLFGEQWVLWYFVSNTYSIVDSEFKQLLNSYLQARNVQEFKLKLEAKDQTSDFQTILNTLKQYLQNCNRVTEPIIETSLVSFDSSKVSILKHYSIQGKKIQIAYDSELVLKLIHPALNYLSTENNKNTDVIFSIYMEDDELFLFKDAVFIIKVPKRDYHLIQGKFIIQLLCTLHNKHETDWIGTFHGSTITDSTNSILFIGESGKGKSTLCALLAAGGFQLLADDLSPMLSTTKDIFYNPMAISIKEGSFSVLERIVEGFENLPQTEFNKTKGLITYLPCASPNKNSYPCRAVVIVNYTKDADTLLETVSYKELLETLIPDSWLSPKPIHAKEFLDWLTSISIYRLTYSDTKIVTKTVSQLFSSFTKI